MLVNTYQTRRRIKGNTRMQNSSCCLHCVLEIKWWIDRSFAFLYSVSTCSRWRYHGCNILQSIREHCKPICQVHVLFLISHPDGQRILWMCTDSSTIIEDWPKDLKNSKAAIFQGLRLFNVSGRKEFKSISSILGWFRQRMVHSLIFVKKILLHEKNFLSLYLPERLYLWRNRKGSGMTCSKILNLPFRVTCLTDIKLF